MILYLLPTVSPRLDGVHCGLLSGVAIFLNSQVDKGKAASYPCLPCFSDVGMPYGTFPHLQ